MARFLIIDSCSSFRDPRHQVNANVDKVKVSIEEDDGTVRVIYTGKYWNEKEWQEQKKESDNQ